MLPDAPTPKTRTVVVGLAGGSAAGKTTFASALVETLMDGTPPLHVETVNLDRYFRRDDPDAPHVTLSTGETLFNANHPESADVPRLLADLETRLNAPDAPDVLIVEGHFALALDAVRSRYDLRLFLELEPDRRALRRLMRDMAGGRGDASPRFIATYYTECARVGHERYVEPSRVHADLILRGDADFRRTARLAAAAIHALAETA